MGRKTRIILLSITAVLAVVTFIAMLAVRPGTESEVLDEARARQQEPLLSVAEPLETDVRTLTEEQEMAEKVREILLADEDFIAAVSSSIESVVPEYVSGWVEGEEAAAVFSGIQERGVEEAVKRIVTDENIDRIAELVASKLGTADSGAFSDATDRIVSIISASLVIPELQKSAISNAIIAYYENNKDAIAEDVIERAISEYSSLSAEDRAELLGSEDIILMLYDEYGSTLAYDVIMEAIAEYSALGDQQKAELLGIGAIANMLYMENRDAIIADVLTSIPEDEPVDAEKIVLDIYSEHKGLFADDVINEAIARYSAMDSRERAELIGMAEIAGDLYQENRSFIIDDISAAILAAIPEAEEIDAEAIAIQLYDEYRDAVAEDVIAYYISHYGIPSQPEPASYEEPEPAVSEEPSSSVKESISAPVFSSSPAVVPGASQEDYNRAREEMRQRELDRLSAFLN